MNAAASSLPGLAALAPEPELARWASWCEGLHFGVPRPAAHEIALPATRLAECIDTLLTGVRALYEGDDERALLSQWSKLYFNLVVPPALVAACVLGRPLAMALPDCTVVLRRGLPHALWLPSDTLGTPAGLGAASAEPVARYRSLCVEHLAPLIEQLAQAVRLAPRVFWSNAANTLEYALVHELPAGAGDAAWLFGQHSFFDTGASNPLYRAIRYVDTTRPGLDAPFRARRVCCLRDRLPGEEMLCSACPLLLTMSDAELAGQMRLRKECE